MSKQRYFSVLWNDLHHYGSYISPTMIGAAALLLIGAGVILALPESTGDQPELASAANAPETALDESLCAKQAWPYIDQRCAERVEAARGSRQVRIVTDKGTSVNVVTPVPIVEAKPKRSLPTAVVAQTERQIGPPAAPQAAEPAPQTEKIAAASQPEPAPRAAPAPAPKVEMAAVPASATPEATNAMAMEPAKASKGRSVSVVGSTISIEPAQTSAASVKPSPASAAPVAPGVEALDEARPKPAKSARAERAQEREARREAKREARRQRALERDIRRGGVPEEVVAAVKALPREHSGRVADKRSVRRSRTAVPDEVIAAVEQATRGRDSGRRVIILGEW